MSVTEPTFHPPMGLLKLLVFYSATRDGRPRGVSGDRGARDGRQRRNDARAATRGMEEYVQITC
ncbi:MAG: hypothetical protein ABGY24_00090, partial [bacterium]